MLSAQNQQDGLRPQEVNATNLVGSSKELPMHVGIGYFCHNRLAKKVKSGMIFVRLYTCSEQEMLLWT